MRISTSQIFQNGVDVMQRQQAEIARTQNQLATGRRILAPSDDPSGSVQTLQFESRVQQTEQYQRNGDLAERRLRLTESTLAGVGDGLQRIRALAVQANNASQTDETRGYLAEEMRQVLDGLVDLANTRDANGEYLFAGYRSETRPFVADATGQIVYQGDDGAREVDISPVRRIAVGDAGSAVFGGILDGNGAFTVIPDAGNSGSGVADGGQVVDRVLWEGSQGDFPVTIEFVNDGEQFRFLDDGGNPIDVTDGEGNTVAAGTPLDFTPGQTIEFNGIQLQVQGRPDAGDSFEIRPSQEQTLFQGLDRMISALETGSGDTTAPVNNAINRGLTELDGALEHVLDVRATVGARLNALESQDGLHEGQILQMETTLSEIRDLDYAEAISRFNLQQVSLKAAQQSYTQVARLSLFDYIR
ncbi:flagellar hook-associated protein FlgL [Ectothiorhodospira mobilis]|uniref:flagellar hook-associated protein FlgL n=1 Tax=Ectothiorhodospira mobilis TaxID=195064 RepID=UPI001EE83742|nr:flagellar hook-associated protein FlgL [Ectothiorhodospira mobilis]MCG5535712.1 flagellar hook-associated protein FlgL [Ectothiorhodospira mobilis]